MTDDEKFEKALGIISAIAERIGDMKALLYPRLTERINDCLWNMYGIEEIKFRLKTATGEDVSFYNEKLAERIMQQKYYLPILN